jgi:hypothetical protein
MRTDKPYNEKSVLQQLLNNHKVFVPLDVIYEWVSAHRQSILTEVLCYFCIPCSHILRHSL